MDFGSLLRVLRRQWLVVLIGALATLALAAVAYTQIPSRYQATARMLLLLPPDSRGEDLVGSPFLYLPNGLNVLARIVALTPTSSDFQASLLEEGFTSQYEVGVDTASPTVTISVEGSDPQDVIETRNRLIEAINGDLFTVQQEEKAPPQQIAHTRVYAAESTPEQIGGDRARGVLSIGGAGAVLTLLGAFLVDRLGQLRQARRRAAPEGGARQRRRTVRRRRADAPTAGDDSEAEPLQTREWEPPGESHNATDTSYEPGGSVPVADGAGGLELGESSMSGVSGDVPDGTHALEPVSAAKAKRRQGAAKRSALPLDPASQGR